MELWGEFGGGSGGQIRSGRGEAISRTPQTCPWCSLVWGVNEAANALKGKEEPTELKPGRFGYGW
jgi:hypothetical protein